ncbi:flagellar motor protein MotB [Hyalangium sp.]|uniref:flagellar motor protein MotB n=1 Tax=Hyalangium sp. TaxID=2028555 RepID=UPI002D4B10BF|nr:flagellar motor protein MotB [Hyalangium sp.]HYH95620.1 flagellar motor protein MotB [Hyalangium sp.]
MARHSFSLCLLALSLLSTSAVAQPRLPSFDLQRLQFEPSSLGSLVVGTGRTLDQGVFRGSFQVHYEQQPLSFDERWDPAAGQALVEGKFTTHLTAAYGVLPWLQVEAQLPVIFNQTGTRTIQAVPPSRAGMGTPWVGARTGLLSVKRGAPVNLGLGVSAGLPVGSSDALAREDFAVFPRLQLGVQSEGYQAGVEVGALLRKEVDISEISQREKDVVGNELRLAATVTSLGGKKTRGELSVLTSVPLGGGRMSTEVLLAIRRHALPWLDLYVLGGPGIGTAFDTPSFRVIAGAAFSNGKID